MAFSFGISCASRPRTGICTHHWELESVGQGNFVLRWWCGTLGEQFQSLELHCHSESQVLSGVNKTFAICKVWWLLKQLGCCFCFGQNFVEHFLHHDLTLSAFMKFKLMISPNDPWLILAKTSSRSPFPSGMRAMRTWNIQMLFIDT